MGVVGVKQGCALRRLRQGGEVDASRRINMIAHSRCETFGGSDAVMRLLGSLGWDAGCTLVSLWIDRLLGVIILMAIKPPEDLGTMASFLP